VALVIELAGQFLWYCGGAAELPHVRLVIVAYSSKSRGRNCV